MAWDYTDFNDFAYNSSNEDKQGFEDWKRQNNITWKPHEFGGVFDAYSQQMRRKELQDKKNNLQGRINDFSNFNSDYYKKQADAIGRATPFTNSFDLMKQDRAQGMDYNVSSTLANERTKQANAARQNSISNSLVGAYLEGQGMANNLMGMDMQNDQYYAGLANQRYMQNRQLQQERDMQPSFGEELFSNILGIGGGIAGSYFGGPASMLSWLNPQGGNSRRMGPDRNNGGGASRGK